MGNIFAAVLAIIALLTVSVISAWAEILLSTKKGPLPGLCVPAILLLIVYASFFTAFFITQKLWIALITLLLMNIPLLISLTIYLVIRRRRYLKNLEAYRRQNKKPVRSPLIDQKTRNRIASFFDEKLPLPAETQREILTRALSGNSQSNISAILDCRIEDVEAVTLSYEKLSLSEDEKEDGVFYSLSEKQKELFLQLMITSSPKSLGCGECLLWSRRALRALICDTVNVNASLEVVDSFLEETEIAIPKALTVTERLSDPAFKKWSEDEFEKIRMRALEESKNIYFCYSVSIKRGRKYSVLSAVSCEGKVTFGIYKGDGGHKDFLDKLSQENSDALILIADGEDNYLKFSSVKSAAEVLPSTT